MPTWIIYTNIKHHILTLLIAYRWFHVDIKRNYVDLRQCGDKDITHRQTYVSSRTLTRTKVAIQSIFQGNWTTHTHGFRVTSFILERFDNVTLTLRNISPAFINHRFEEVWKFEVISSCRHSLTAFVCHVFV